MAEPPELNGARRGPTREQVRRRRLTALAAVVVVLVAGGVAAGIAFTRSGPHAAPPPTTVAQERQFRIVFPEGFTRAQMAERVTVVAAIARRKNGGRAVRLNAKAYLAASRRGIVPCFVPRRRTNLEGFLFPATYDFVATTTAKQLVADQVQAFCAEWRSVSQRYARSKNLTSYDVLKIASMIEKEAVVASERGLISAVIYNRLREGMALGIDATLRYGLHIPPTQSITESELQSSNPYNTRKLLGLPPTPIANPGLASIRAAAHPAKVDYLYFVRKPDTIHHFFTASVSAFDQYECAHGYGC